MESITVYLVITVNITSVNKRKSVRKNTGEHPKRGGRGWLSRKLTDLPGISVISVLVLCNSTTIRLFNVDKTIMSWYKVYYSTMSKYENMFFLMETNNLHSMQPQSVLLKTIN